MKPVLKISGAQKSFLLHQQDAAKIDVFDDLDFVLHAGEAVGLLGTSGAGKSSLLKLIYGTYKHGGGTLGVLHQGKWINMPDATPRTTLDIRQSTIGYVTQFLRVIPRVPCLDVVAEPLIERGASETAALSRAKDLLSRLNIPETLWGLSPLTFSGGEQQRVNIARGFSAPYPILLLDEPTASLDPKNRSIVLGLIGESIEAGTAVIAIFHDPADRDAVCSTVFNIEEARRAA